MDKTKPELHKIFEIIESAKDNESINEGDFLRLANTMKIVFERMNFDPTICKYSKDRMCKIGLRTSEGIIEYTAAQGFITCFIETERRRKEEIDVLKATNDSIMETLKEKNEEISRLSKLIKRYQHNLHHRTPKKEDYESITTLGNDKVECKHCGSILSPNSLKRHFKTKKCKKARRDARRF